MGTCFFFFDLCMPTPGAVRDMLHVVSTLPGFLRTPLEKVAYHEKGNRILGAPPAVG